MIPAVVLSLVCSAAVPAETAISQAAILNRAEDAIGRALADPGGANAASSFAVAAADYNELCRGGAENAALRRNEGNACLLAGNIPAAILAYREGLRLAPGDPRLLSGLNAARRAVVYPPSGLGRPPADWPSWLPRLNPVLALGLAAGLYSLGWLIGVCWRLTGRPRLAWIGAASWMIALALGATLVLGGRLQARDRDQPITVIDRDGVVLRRGNGEAYPAAYEVPLNRGVEARLRCRRGGWVQIELSGGEIGWLPRAAVLCDSL